jgi:hypothetical protein
MPLVFIPVIILVELLTRSSTSETAFLTFSVSRFRPLVLLKTVDRVRKIMDRKQKTDVGKYSIVNRTIRNWNQLPADTLRTFPCKPKILEREESIYKRDEAEGIEVWRKSSKRAVQ